MATRRWLSGSAQVLLAVLVLSVCAPASAGSTSTDPAVQCVATLAQAGVLFDISASSDLTFVGPCAATNAYGACESVNTGAELYSVCTDECRAEVDQVPSDCVDALSSFDDSLATLFERCSSGSREPSDCDGTEPTPTASTGGSGDDTPPEDSPSTPTDGGDCAAELADKGALFEITSTSGSTTNYGPAGACILDDAYGECTDGSAFCSQACRGEVAEVSSTCEDILSEGTNGEIFTQLLGTCKGSGKTSCGSAPSPPAKSPTARRPSPVARPSSRPSPSSSRNSTSEPALAPEDEGGATPGGACAASLADRGALYEAVSSTGDITEYQPAGPCIEDDAFGQCVDSRTNEPVFDFCSAGCRADLAQANSTCRAILGDSSLYFAAILRRCDGDGATDCEGGSSPATEPVGSLPPLPSRPTSSSGGLDTDLDTPTRRPTSSSPTARAADAPEDAAAPIDDTLASTPDQRGSAAAQMGALPLFAGLAGGMLMLAAAA